MSTTSGEMSKLKVTDKNGNVFSMDPVDSTARQQIDDAKLLQFDDAYFTAAETNYEVNIGLNGVQFGVESPLMFVEDSANGIVLGTDAPYSTALAPGYEKTTYSAGDKCTNENKLYICKADIDVPEDWTPAHWEETDAISEIEKIVSVPAPGTTSKGKVLTVNSSDEVVWDTPSSSASVKENQGLYASGSYIGVECAGTGGLIADSNGLYIAHTSNDKGKFLTVSDDNEITWGTPSGGGGGGGGNPYTKVSVTPGEAYYNGTKSAYDYGMYDQDVTIANNSYSIVDTDIGYDAYRPSSAENPYPGKGIDNFNIKLPNGTEFPMAVVEFELINTYSASVNNVNVFVGNTKLTRMYDAPHYANIVMADDNDGVDYQSTGDHSNYYTMQGIYPDNLSANYGAFVVKNDSNPKIKVQVHIFGSCYRITSNAATAKPSAS